MKKKFLSIVLCFAMVFTLLPISPSYASSEFDVEICAGSEAVDSVILSQNEKIRLTAISPQTDELQCQWQIQTGKNFWVNIAGEETSTLEISYAMVASILKEDTATVRCLATWNRESVFSGEVAIKVDYGAESSFDEENDVIESDIDGIVDSAADCSSQNPSDASSTEDADVSSPAGEEAGDTESAETADPSDADASAPADNSGLFSDFRLFNIGSDSNALREAPEAPLEDTPEPQVDPAGDDANTTYNVVINYAFENGSVAGDPYTATLAAGSNFSATVTFPTVQGYLPYLNNEQKNSVDLNYTSIDQDYTINVVYKPTNVNYTVIHYKQNVDDDKYTEVERETKQGLTNNEVQDAAKTYDGFYALLYEKPEIAADGSTVVEIYYDRYYYLMNFDMDGGYGVQPIYARYETPIKDIGKPTRAGYTFKGWTLDDVTAEIPKTMPAKNRTYKAVWAANDTAKVTIVFWGENADDEGYSYIKSNELQLKPGTEFTYSESGSLICGQEDHKHSAACYNLTCTKEEHTHIKDCYKCGEESHTHGTECYAGVGNASSAGIGAPWNPVNGYVAREAFSIGKVIYINGTWYEYTGNTKKGEIAPSICGKTEGDHTHTDACLGCGKTEHTHSVENGCYTLTCTKQEHTHTSDCYMSGTGLDPNLWTFEGSDTVKVAADGSSVVNVYYDRTEKALTFNYNYRNNGYQKTETITAKWGSNIAEQYKKIAANAGSTFWSAQTNGNGPYTNYFGIMPQTSATYYNKGKSGYDGTMTYWGQDLNGEYTVKLFEVTGVGGYYVTDEDRYEFEGFTYHHGTSNGSDCGGAAFYYTRNSYTLTFNDGYNDVKTESVKYEALLGTYSDYIPDVPSAYEPGSVVFGGWYLNPECSGAEYKLNEHTMPADNVLLYAKWVPVSHTVEFYLDYDAYDAGTKLDTTHPDIKVPHGSKVEPTPEAPTNGSYTFVGWFYMEGEFENAFDFANMPVNKDLKVYGRWSSNVLKPYTIYYKIQGTDTPIADPTTGSGLAGITKTFDAKGGTDLYADYQEGYFPVAKSHSMTLDINATEENDTNVYTFWYVQKEAVPYTVKYLNKETGAPVADEKKVSDNRKAVVTETFEPVPGMMPDAYQKRLVVSAEEGAVNEIIFYYTEDTAHAYYKITHYTENLAKDSQGNTTWTEYASSQAMGDIGTTYTADPMTIPGFTYESTVTGTVASGELTAKGLELKLYYTRNEYPYQVRYLEQGTGKQLEDPKNGKGKYGQVVSESAIDITDYEAVDPKSQTLNIRIEEGTEAKLNIITFYYKEKEVTINYQVIGPEGCGTVSPESETVKVMNGTAQGSTPTANENFRFIGWFTDEECKSAVTDIDGMLDENKFTPSQKNGKYEAATYYAKFDYDLADLTISKSGWEDIDENQSFIFTVTGSNGFSLDVVIHGNGSATITGLPRYKENKLIEYTVTEKTGWSWRYTPDNEDKQITLQHSTNEVQFKNSRSSGYWLSGDWFKENQFELKAITESN